MLVSPSKALNMYQVSKPTLYADMKTGKLSFTKDDRGKRKVDIAELERLYPKREEGAFKPLNNNVRKSLDQTFSNVGSGTADLEKQLLEQKVGFLEEQIRSQEGMIERWQDAFDKAQKTADKITALIEDRSNQKVQGIDQEKIDRLEKTIQKLVEREEERIRKMEERRLQKQEARQRELEDIQQPAQLEISKPGRGFMKFLFR